MMYTDRSVVGWYQLILSTNQYLSQVLKYMPLNEVSGDEFSFVSCGGFHVILDCAFGLQVYSVSCSVGLTLVLVLTQFRATLFLYSSHKFWVFPLSSHAHIFMVCGKHVGLTDKRDKLKWWLNFFFYFFFTVYTVSLTRQIMIFLSSLTHSEYQNISHASSETEPVPKACK